LGTDTRDETSAASGGDVTKSVEDTTKKENKVGRGIAQSWIRNDLTPIDQVDVAAKQLDVPASPKVTGATTDAANEKVGKKKKKKKTQQPIEESQSRSQVPDQGGIVSSDDASSSCLKVCVGNLHWELDKDAIRRHFEKCGRVTDVYVLVDWYTQYSRGIAFVTFVEALGVKAALALNGTEVKGQNIRINLALDRPAKGKTKGSGKDGKDSTNAGKSKGKGKGKGAPALFALGNVEASSVEGPPAGCPGVVVKSLSYETTDAELTECFGKCGRGPKRVRVLKNNLTGESKGKAILDFDEAEGMKAAVALSGTLLRGRKIYIEYLRGAQP